MLSSSFFYKLYSTMMYDIISENSEQGAREQSLRQTHSRSSMFVVRIPVRIRSGDREGNVKCLIL